MASLGNITLIANPTAQNGRGEELAHKAESMLAEALGPEAVTLLFTEAQFHASELAAQAAKTADTVVVLGGDGAVHEAVNGLMTVSPEKRPQLGIIPVGSGSDYALTLGIATHDVEKAVSQLLEAKALRVDLGQCNGEYFAETLSFGLDAAIAIESMERRKRTGKTGTRLYLEAGINQLFHHLNPLHFHVTFYGVPESSSRHALIPPSNTTLHFEDEAYLFAAQIGPTYGAHFRICPDASITDEMLHICMAHPPLNPLQATFVFLMAKNGHHTKFKSIEMLKAESFDIDFDKPPACQMDGEEVMGTEFHVSVVPKALTVLAAKDIG